MTPILFVDRDGTLIEEPADFRIDSFAKLRFVQDAIPALQRLRDAGYQFVIVTNQDGLGTSAFPRADFEGPHDLMLQVFASAGLVFRDVLIDTSYPQDNAPTRKPGIGLALPYVQDRNIDWKRSAMVGDRETDNQFATNLGIRAFQLRTPQFGGEWDWPGIAHVLADAPRNGPGYARHARDPHCRSTRSQRRRQGFHTHGFFDHMLEQLGKHGGFALELSPAIPHRHHTAKTARLRQQPAKLSSAASRATASPAMDEGWRAQRWISPAARGLRSMDASRASA